MSNKLISWILFIALSFIWGSSFILMKMSARDMTASQIAAVRIFCAGAVFVPFMFFHLRKVPAKKLGWIIMTGILGNLMPAFLFAAAISKHIDSSLVSIMNSLTPLWVVLTAVLLFKAKIAGRKVLGVLVGFAGLCLLSFSKGISLENAGYVSLVILATLLYGINVNIVSFKLQGINPLHGASISLAFMTIPTAAVLWYQGFGNLAFDDPAFLWSTIIAATLGVIGSALATLLFYILVRKSGGIFASLVTYGIPVVALFWGFLDQEAITLLQVLCLAIILSGVYLANSGTKKMETAKE